MVPTDKDTVDKVMAGLPPQARTALNMMAEMQKRPAEDVLRDEIQNYIEGRLPLHGVEAAVKAIQDHAYQAGYIVGSLKKFVNFWTSK